LIISKVWLDFFSVERREGPVVIKWVCVLRTQCICLYQVEFFFFLVELKTIFKLLFLFAPQTDCAKAKGERKSLFKTNLQRKFFFQIYTRSLTFLLLQTCICPWTMRCLIANQVKWKRSTWKKYNAEKITQSGSEYQQLWNFSKQTK
jgi:hypothetical protein